MLSYHSLPSSLNSLSLGSSLSFLLVAELGLSTECGLLFRAPSPFSLLCTVFLLNAAVFADLALYLAVGGLCLGGASLVLLQLSCFKHVWHRFIGCLSLCGAFHALLPLSLSSSPAVGSRSATSYLQLRCCLLEICIIASCTELRSA